MGARLSTAGDGAVAEELGVGSLDVALDADRGAAVGRAAGWRDGRCTTRESTGIELGIGETSVEGTGEAEGAVNATEDASGGAMDWRVPSAWSTAWR
jgi:hypothetical protein